MLGALAGKILMQILGNLIGYNFVTEVLVIGLKQWAESTQNKKDDKVVAAVAKALGVDPKVLQD